MTQGVSPQGSLGPRLSISTLGYVSLFSDLLGAGATARAEGSRKRGGISWPFILLEFGAGKPLSRSLEMVSVAAQMVLSTTPLWKILQFFSHFVTTWQIGCRSVHLPRKCLWFATNEGCGGVCLAGGSCGRQFVTPAGAAGGGTTASRL